MLQNRVRHIQVLRGIAVLLVLAFHAYEPIFPLGYLGVDIFFVISGFVISPSIIEIGQAVSAKQALQKLKKFYSRRVMRLLPGFSVFIVVSALALILLASIDDHHKISSQAAFSIIGFGNIGAYFFSGDYFNPNPNPYIHLWSLAAEEQLYMFLPLFALIMLRNRKISRYVRNKSFLKLTVLSLIFFSIANLLDSQIRVLNIFSDYYSPFSKVWLFALGGFLRHSPLTIASINRKFRTISFTFLFIILVGLGVIIASPFRLSQFFGLILAGTFATLFISLGQNNLFKNGFFSPLKYIGDRSYSIYLFHMPFFYLAKYSPLSGDNFYFRLLMLVIAFILTFILAGLNYTFIENRFRMKTGSETASILRLIAKFNIPAVVLVSIMFFGSQSSYGLSVPSDRASIAKPETYSCGFEINNIVCFDPSAISRPYVLVLGDSHARHYLDVLHEVSSERGMSMVYAPINIIASENVKGLQSLNQSKLRELFQIRKPSVVVLSELVYSNSIGADLRGPLNWLYGYVSDVVIVGQSPRFVDKNRFMHFMYPSLISRFIVSPPAVAIREAELEIDSLRAGYWLREVSLANGFNFIDSLKVLCPTSSCLRKNGAGWLYVDDHHLSTHGADLMKQEFELALG